ncbi:MAG TPA: serine/threonine-protein kinase, partial [Nannocystaceae bacterium]|nr:serine/threonine-protein kinase [Nannocystaceae bacterium]
MSDLRDEAPAVTLASDDGHRGDERGRTFARGETIGRYVVIDRIGEGGMGIVYAAYDPELDRKLALKLLHHDTGDRAEARRLRLVREAQAMARLSHRNVIVVHDVGTFDDQVFVAMEFIDGRSLAAWLASTPKPSWSEVLGVLVEAGQGLAAAHDAGLVHRDFKPDNVMIANESAGLGRVVVTDFGLARAAGNNEDSGALPMKPDEHDASVSRLAGKGTLAATVTAVGAIMGTPAYMAPEQHLGRPADARSDQFAFAVVLYEGIYGQRPFPGDDVASLAYHVTAGNLREPPAQSNVPGWLARVLVRALAIDPRTRYPDMHALLDELVRDRSWRPRWWAIAAGVGAAALTGVYAGFALDREPAPCSAGADRIAAVWNSARAEAIHARFAQTGLSYVEEQWPVLRAELQSYAKQWSGAYVDACEATHVRGEQSDALLDARMLCLSRRIDELGALLELF